MFVNAGNPGKFKQAAYLLATIILGLFLSFLFHATIEMIYLFVAQKYGYVVYFYGGCALHPVLQAVIWLVGLSGGLLVGRVWWRKVYIEKVWSKK